MTRSDPLTEAERVQAEIARDVQWLRPVNEALVDRWIERAASYHGNSDTSLKYACITASPVVRKYNGGTAEIAKLTKRSSSSVESWAHAHWLYVELRRNLSDFQRVRILWRTLPASHWWLAYDIQRLGYDAFYYLDNADLHSWSGRDMMREYSVDMERRNGHKPPIPFERACIRFKTWADEMMLYSLTPGQTAAVKAVQKEFGK